MYGMLRGVLVGCKIAFDHNSFKTTIDNRISNISNTIQIKSIHIHYDITVPPKAHKTTKHALHLHPENYPAHQNMKDTINISWDATLRINKQTITIHEKRDTTT